MNKKPPEKVPNGGHAAIVVLIVVPIIIAGLLVAYLVVKDETIRLGIVGLAILMALIGLIVVYDHFFSVHNKLKRKLAMVPSVTKGESLEVMKKFYQDIYHLYNKLSEHKKQNFYAQITDIRERIERKLKADKKMELLIGNIGKGNLTDQKNNYQQMHEVYTRLPDSMKKKYYSHLSHAKSLLEKGK
jgi:hypothetical protein